MFDELALYLGRAEYLLPLTLSKAVFLKSSLILRVQSIGVSTFELFEKEFSPVVTEVGRPFTNRLKLFHKLSASHPILEEEIGMIPLLNAVLLVCS